MQMADAQRRLEILKSRMASGQGVEGVSLHDVDDGFVDAVAEGQAVPAPGSVGTGPTEWGRRDVTINKKRRRGDDDGERVPEGQNNQGRQQGPSNANASLTGPDGFINLFQDDPSATGKGGQKGKNKEHMAEQKRKEEEFEAQYTMKLERPAAPWYSTPDLVAEVDKAREEAIKQKGERVQARVREENDPMKVMRSGLAKLREVRSEAALDRRKRDVEVGIGLSGDVEKNAKRHREHEQPGYENRRRDRSRSRDRRRRSASPSRNQGRRHGHKDRRRSRSRSREQEREGHGHRHRSASNDRKKGGERRDRRSRHDRDDRHQRSHRSRQSRSRSTSRDRSHRKEKEKNGESSSISKLREEKLAREAKEREKAQSLVEAEMSFRNPEHWRASNTGGRGKYSKQFGD